MVEERGLGRWSNWLVFCERKVFSSKDSLYPKKICEQSSKSWEESGKYIMSRERRRHHLRVGNTVSNESTDISKDIYICK
jgi:hypothetical protein